MSLFCARLILLRSSATLVNAAATVASNLTDYSMNDHQANRESGGVPLFWVAVCSLITATFIALYAVGPGSYQRSRLYPLYEPVHYIATGILVAVVWAILYRSQVAKFHISLTAIFVLMLMESVYLLAIRFANPSWAFGP
jgi:hypothetical protein